MGVFQWTINVFKCAKTNKVDKKHVMVPTWVSETWICCNTYIEKKEWEACASDVQIQVVCASQMLCVCTSCVDVWCHWSSEGI